MAEPNAEDVVRLTSSPPSANKSPDSDVSPRTQPPPSVPADYFSSKPDDAGRERQAPLPSWVSKPSSGGQRPNGRSATSMAASTDASTTTLASISEESHVSDWRQSSSNDGREPPSVVSGKSSSTASVKFRPPRNPLLPQGHPRKTDNRRLRESSPSPVR